VPDMMRYCCWRIYTAKTDLSGQKDNMVINSDIFKRWSY
jgi:hypothetical protein